MTTLAANKPRGYFAAASRVYNQLGLAAATNIYEGAAVGVVLATGLVRPLVAGDRFVGFAEARADNTAHASSILGSPASSGAAGAVSCRIVSKEQVELPVASVAITDIGQPVYATDDDTFALTASGSFIGFVHRFISTGVCVVDYDAPARRDPSGQTG